MRFTAKFDHKLFFILWTDLFVLRHTLNLKRSANRRVYAKEVMSAIEGTTHALKMACARIIGNYRVSFSFHEVVALEGVQVNIGPKGTYAQEKFFNTEHNAIYAIEAFVKFNKIRRTSTLRGMIGRVKDVLSQGVKIRNRVVHPKKLSGNAHF